MYQNNYQGEKNVRFKKVIKGFDQDEEHCKSVKLFGSVLLMDDGSVVVIICHKAIPKEEATKYGIKALWFF
jgi:hypothetical protein